MPLQAIGRAHYGMLRRGPESVDAPAIHTFRPDPLGKRENPRRYGGASSTLQDPALVMPMLTARPGSWKETPIRPDFPEDVRAWLDQADKQRLHDSLKAIA